MKVSAVIPAYNEEKTVGSVVETLQKVDCIAETIVVSDGSKDTTPVIAEAAGAKVIVLPDNVGKGGAMMVGAKESSQDILLFLDADLVGLRPDHVLNLIKPVLDDEAEMTVGIFERGRAATDLAQFFAPFLSGQRAIKKNIITDLTNLDVTRFGVEVALTRYVAEHHLRAKEVLLPELTHIMKEEKLGLLKGFAARMRMYWEIAKTYSCHIVRR
ncbi:glycosyltransferase family 2 protein [Bacillota bacterium LX-D]|nr:glycosyltransferase family 2 protein [Bacillota bacterium LX-D]